MAYNYKESPDSVHNLVQYLDTHMILKLVSKSGDHAVWLRS